VAAEHGAFLSLRALRPVPTSKRKEGAAMLKGIHGQEDGAAARQSAEQVASNLRAKAAAPMAAGIEETSYHHAFSA
jgi:hypothetical protein